MSSQLFIGRCPSSRLNLFAKSRRFPVSAIAATAGLLLLGAACSSNTAAVGESEGAKTVNPNGNDIAPGKFVVVAPAGLDQPSIMPTVYLNAPDTSEVTFGTPVERDPGSNYCLWFSEAHPAHGSGVLRNNIGCFNVVIESMKTTTFDQIGQVSYVPLELNGLEYWLMDQVLETTYAGVPGEFQEYPSSGIMWRPAGSYHASFGSLYDGLDYTVAAGKKVTVDLLSVAGRRAVKVLPPTDVAFPDACTDATFTVRTKDQAREQDFSATRPNLIGEYAGAGQPPRTYEIAMRHSPQVVASLSMSANAGAAPTVLQLGRIDVNDVSVKLNDGTTQVRAGRYTVERINGTATEKTCANDAPTKTGLTVVSGTYRVTTTFPAIANAAPDVQTVVIP